MIRKGWAFRSGFLRLCALLVLLCSLALAQEGVISDIVIRGNRRIPADTIKARMSTRPGDVYDQASLERDFNALWNTGYFDDLRLEREQTPKGWIIYVYVKEKPTIREIKYVGLNSFSQSDLLDKFKERKVGLSQESQFDPTIVKKAETVIKEMEAAHGHQFATIRTEVRPIPPAAVGITFIIKEGIKVKVGKIKFEGNKHVSSRTLRWAMKNSHPIGIPHSLILENLFSRTFDATKLNEDAERVRYEYQSLGYYKAIVEDPKTKIRDKTSVAWYNPFKVRHGKVVDITVSVEEGNRYRLKEITFNGNKAISNVAALRKNFRMKDGDIFNAELVRKGLEDLRKLYGAYGYINFTAVPETEFDEAHKLITLRIDIDEGKQFFVRRIEFQGNTSTRDKVIRRQLALEEGNVYNSQLWELSLLRLNQLSFFEPLKPEQDSDIHQNVAENSVDITLKVKEKGKNSIGLTGGVSGLSGPFVGLNFTTNNFLGTGASLQVQGNVGQYERDALLGFTQPYLFDRPLQAGFTVYTRRYNYNQLRQASISSSAQLALPTSVLNSFQNYTQSSTGFTLTASYPIRRSFKRVGLAYGFDITSISTFTTASQFLFQDLSFRGISGPNALNGIRTSKLTPSFTYNHIDVPMRPHNGNSFYMAAEVAGVGGNVNMVRPIIEYKQFIPMKGLRMKYGHPEDGRQTLGFRIQASHVRGYGGNDVSPFERFFLGGDTDLRGFDIRAVSPVAFLPTQANITLQNPDGSAVLVDPNNPRRGGVSVSLPIDQLVYPGGDTSLVSNIEYRMPIAGPVTLAAFVDTGWNLVLVPSELKLAPNAITSLAQTAFGCATVSPVTLTCVGTTIPAPSSAELTPISGTNGIPRMSTGLELQVILPVVNAPFRVYYAVNPMRMETVGIPPVTITRNMFPAGGAGDFTFHQAMATYGAGYRLREPWRTFRFTVATTF